MTVGPGTEESAPRKHTSVPNDTSCSTFDTPGIDTVPRLVPSVTNSWPTDTNAQRVPRTAKLPEPCGLAAMTAGLVDKGTATRSAQQIAEAIDSAGGSLGASADWDSITASTTVLSNRAQLAADLLADVLINPTFKDDEVERLRTQTLSGLQLSQSNAGSVADEVFDKVVYGLKPYARPLGGTPESVRAITRDDIVKFHKAQYVPNNATLAIVGNIKAADAFALAEKAFGAWQRGSDFAMPRPAPSGRSAASGRSSRARATRVPPCSSCRRITAPRRPATCPTG